MISSKSTITLICSLSIIIYISTAGSWSKHYLILALTLPMASLCSLLILNTAVLYIYIKYFVSPQVNARRLENSFKPLRLTHKSIWPQLHKLRILENQHKPTALTHDEDIDAAFNALLQYVLRDFIQSWFVKITGTLSEQSFPFAVDHIIRGAASQLTNRLNNTDVLQMVLNKIIPRMTAHIADFHTAEVSLRGKSLERSVTQSDELDLLLASRFRGGKLHTALTTAAVTTKPTEIVYLRHLIERVLPYIMDHKELQSGPVRVVMREIISNSVLQPVLDMLADPDFWNQTIDAYLGKAIIEQKMVRQLREVLNRHSSNHDGDTIDTEEEVMNVFKPTRADRLQQKKRNESHGAQKVDKLQKMGPKTQFSAAYLGTGIGSSHIDYGEGHQEGSEEDDQETDDESNTSSRDTDANDASVSRYTRFPYFDSTSIQSIKKKQQYGFGSIKMGKRTFQDFLQMIQEERNLLDLKRVRNDIVTQIRKKRAQIADRDPEEIMDGEKVEDVLVYINRLSVAKKRVDKRIAVLSGDQFDFKKSTSQLFGVRGRKQSTTSHSLSIGYNLKDILTNTSGLSYFMEFMDRRGDMVKLQFWLMVEGFNSTTDVTQDEERKTFLQDVKMMYEMYFTETAPHRLHIADQLVKDLKNTIQLAMNCSEQAAFANHIRELRLRLIRIQQHVFWEIEKEHYPYFKRSDLYFKFLSSAPPVTSNIMTTTNTLDDIEEVHTRRSLDENTLYQSSSPSPPILNTNRPASIHSTRAAIASPAPNLADSSASYFFKPKGHQRTLSDSTAKASSRFLSFSNMFAHNRSLWQTTEPIGPQNEQDFNSSTPISIKSLEETEDDDEDNYKEQRQPEETLETPKRGRLVRSNTVDAVEAELRSILDGNILEEITPLTNKDEDVVKESLRPKPISLPASSSTPLLSTSQLLLKPSSSSSALLLCGTKGVKSTTAMPIQNDYPLPSWTSSGGTNAISEIEHDSLESVLPSNKSNSSSTNNTLTTSPTPMINKPSTLESQSTVEDEAKTTINNVHFAPPGDLMLAAKVQQLSEEVEKLTAQEAIVDALIIKAESQQKVEELRILKKSKSMFRQELQQIQYQKSQYELQESENVLMPQRSQVTITSATIGSDKHGDFALYVIEIQQLGMDGNYASGWIVARRYSEFFALHQKLKEQFPVVRLMEFPSKWPSSFLKLQKPFVETRRLSLERYLRKLIQHKEICESQAFRSFLSQQNIFVPGPDTEWPLVGNLFSNNINGSALQTSSSSSSLHSLASPSIQNLQKSIAAVSTTDEGNHLLHKKPSKGFMRHIYKTVAAGIDDILIGPSMLDLITQRLGEQVMEFSVEDNTSASSARSKDVGRSTDFATTIANTATTATTSELPDALKAEGITRFTEPLCDLFIEMFELKDKTNWLRRQAVVIILQQILEGTIERKLRETLKYLCSSSMIVFYLNKITNSLWPDGGPLTFKEPRKPEEKLQTREEANRKLSTWLPDLLGNMVGRQNARKGARRLFTVLQNKRLNQDLVYTLLDEIVSALFPELPIANPNNDTTQHY